MGTDDAKVEVRIEKNCMNNELPRYDDGSQPTEGLCEKEAAARQAGMEALMEELIRERDQLDAQKDQDIDSESTLAPSDLAPNQKASEECNRTEQLNSLIAKLEQIEQEHVEFKRQRHLHIAGEIDEREQRSKENDGLEAQAVESHHEELELTALPEVDPATASNMMAETEGLRRQLEDERQLQSQREEEMRTQLEDERQLQSQREEEMRTQLRELQEKLTEKQQLLEDQEKSNDGAKKNQRRWWWGRPPEEDDEFALRAYGSGMRAARLLSEQRLAENGDQDATKRLHATAERLMSRTPQERQSMQVSFARVGRQTMHAPRQEVGKAATKWTYDVCRKQVESAHREAELWRMTQRKLNPITIPSSPKDISNVTPSKRGNGHSETQPSRTLLEDRSPCKVSPGARRLPAASFLDLWQPPIPN